MADSTPSGTNSNEYMNKNIKTQKKYKNRSYKPKQIKYKKYYKSVTFTESSNRLADSTPSGTNSNDYRNKNIKIKNKYKNRLAIPKQKYKIFNINILNIEPKLKIEYIKSE